MTGVAVFVGECGLALFIFLLVKLFSAAVCRLALFIFLLVKLFSAAGGDDY